VRSESVGNWHKSDYYSLDHSLDQFGSDGIVRSDGNQHNKKGDCDEVDWLGSGHFLVSVNIRR